VQGEHAELPATGMKENVGIALGATAAGLAARKLIADAPTSPSSRSTRSNR
jgi:hypothetical protein